MTKDWIIHRRHSLRVVVAEGMMIDGMTSIKRRFATFRKKKQRITLLFSSLAQMRKGASMLNGLLHSNDYEERQVIRCTKVFLTAPHSSLDSSAAATPWCTNIGFVNSLMSATPWIACKGSFIQDPPHDKPLTAASAMGS
ncbi:hypothetical protein TNCV_4732981 [Trichonephila clavipes]|nr:hypothetical protein TNCV_4732981 [Trichonephila clavipes]